MKKTELSTITIILRGFEYNKVRAIAKVMEGTDIRNVEITSNSPDMLNTIKKIKTEFPDINVGAGTVLNIEQAKKCIEYGAEFILSPIQLDKDIIEYCKEKEVLTVPSGFTPTEIYKMVEYGADIVKVFPANAIGAKFFKDIQAPLGKLDLMAVGGVNKDNAKEYLDNGCKYLGIGTGMFNVEDIENENVEGLKKSLEEYIRLLEVKWENF